MSRYTIRFACAAVVAGFVAVPAVAQERANFAELGGSTYNITSDDGVDGIRATGPGAFGRVRVFVENDWFVQADAQAAFADGETLLGDFDLDMQFYRFGIGKANAIGQGVAIAALWAEVVHARTKLKMGGLSESDSDTGFGVHLRIDRLAEFGRFLPYVQAGYVSVGDFDGPEGRVGIRVNTGSAVQPFVEYQYLRFKDEDETLTSRAFHAGLRFVF